MLKVFPRPPQADNTVHGDDHPIPNSSAHLREDHLDNSLPDFDRSNLKKGYTDMGSIKTNTKSDEPDWA